MEADAAYYQNASLLGDLAMLAAAPFVLIRANFGIVDTTPPAPEVSQPQMA